MWHRAGLFNKTPPGFYFAVPLLRDHAERLELKICDLLRETPVWLLSVFLLIFHLTEKVITETAKKSTLAGGRLGSTLVFWGFVFRLERRRAGEKKKSP